MLADFSGKGCFGGVGSLGRGFTREGPKDGVSLLDTLLAVGWETTANLGMVRYCDGVATGGVVRDTDETGNCLGTAKPNDVEA